MKLISEKKFMETLPGVAVTIGLVLSLIPAETAREVLRSQVLEKSLDVQSVQPRKGDALPRETKRSM
jgi:hypothetical protein